MEQVGQAATTSQRAADLYRRNVRLDFGSNNRPIEGLHVPADTSAPPFRLGPSLGRRFVMNANNRDLAFAFKSLEITCARNKVRQDMHKQRFHERPGLKRKRLHSERWRRRFKADFQAVCRRVEDLRRKGW